MNADSTTESGRPLALRAAWLGPCLLYLLLAGTGLTWGLPNDRSWSNDDIAPVSVLRVGEFYAGVPYKYPYLQLLIDRVLYEPYIRLSEARGQFQEGCRPVRPDCFVEPSVAMGHLILISRLRSLLMGLATIVLVASTAAMLYGPQAGFWAAMLAASNETLGFFGKQGNLDVPAGFWFMTSLLLWLRILRGGGRRDWLAFGLVSGAALATKESIVGAYVLMGGSLLVSMPRQLRRIVTEQDTSAKVEAVWRLGLLTLGLLGVYGLTMNVVFNWTGFVQHLRHWVGGPGVEDFNDAYAGPLWLARMIWDRAVDGAGWPLWLFLAAGPFVTLVWPGEGRNGTATASRHATLWLMIPLASYLLFTILPIRFVYSRFLLPVYLLLAIVGGSWAARLWNGPSDPRTPTAGGRRLVGRMSLIALLTYSSAYSLNEGLAMRVDTRLAAERWLTSHVPPGIEVVAFGDSAQFPRLGLLDLDSDVVPWRDLPPYLDADDSESDDEPTAAARALSAMMLDSDDTDLQPPAGAPEWLLLSSRSVPPAGTAGFLLQDRLRGGRAGYDLIWDSNDAYPGIAREGERASPLSAWLPGLFIERRVSPRIWVLRKRSLDGD